MATKSSANQIKKATTSRNPRMAKVNIDNSMTMPEKNNNLTPPPEAYSSIENFLNAFTHNEHRYCVFKKDQIDSIMLPFYNTDNGIISGNFWQNICWIDNEVMNKVNANPDNVRFTIEPIHYQNKKNKEMLEMTIVVRYIEEPILKLIDGNELPIDKFIHFAHTLNTGTTIAGNVLFNLMMYRGKMRIGFRNAYGNAAMGAGYHSPLSGINGSFHQAKIDVVESLHGIKDHMFNHPAHISKISDDVDFCESKIGLHPIRGWCALHKDGSVTPLLDMISTISENKLEYENCERLLKDLRALVNTVKFIEDMNLYLKARNMKPTKLPSQYSDFEKSVGFGMPFHRR